MFYKIIRNLQLMFHWFQFLNSFLNISFGFLKIFKQRYNLSWSQTLHSMILLRPTADKKMLRRDKYCTRPWGYLAMKDFSMTITVSGLQQKFSTTVKFQVISVQLIFPILITGSLQWDHSFSTLAKCFEKLTFLNFWYKHSL